jgi:hypothetical protein
MSSLATAAVLTLAPWATRCLATLEPRQAQWLDSFGFCQFTYPGSLGDIKNYSCCIDAQGAKVIKQLDCFGYCQCTCLGSLGNTLVALPLKELRQGQLLDGSVFDLVFHCFTGFLKLSLRFCSKLRQCKWLFT